MGFLDRAKSVLQKVGDENVRVMDVEKEQGTPDKKSRKGMFNNAKKGKTSSKQHKTQSKPQHSSKTQEQPLPKMPQVDEDSAFNLDNIDDSFLDQKSKEFDAMMNSYSDVPQLEVHDNKVQDVLEVLQISPTFDIESDVFMPDDLQDVEFDLQTPYGYDQGQVNNFLNGTKVTVKRYVELLTQRNEDIAKLATVVDRLQVDNHNLKYDNEINSGINIIPTGDQSLDNKLMEEKLKVKRLEDELKKYENIDTANQISDSEREKFNELQDNLSLSRRENEELRKEIYGLKNAISLLEEELDALQNPQNDEDDDDVDLPIPGFEDTHNTQNDNIPGLGGIPGLGDDNISEFDADDNIPGFNTFEQQPDVPLIQPAMSQQEPVIMEEQEAFDIENFNKDEKSNNSEIFNIPEDDEFLQNILSDDDE